MTGMFEAGDKNFVALLHIESVDDDVMLWAMSALSFSRAERETAEPASRYLAKSLRERPTGLFMAGPPSGD